MSTDESKKVSNPANGLRFDLVIAVCALLISSLATGASWWQARVLQAQTQVLENQLGAQVWPYVSTNISVDGSTIKIDIENDGLGPAVMRSFSATVDGRSKGNFIDVLHALLGPNIRGRAKGQNLQLSLGGVGNGAVLRSGDSVNELTFKSKKFAAPLLRGFARIDFSTCYCAIIPGKCWQSSVRSSRDPQPVETCHEVKSDLLHAPVVEELLNQNY